MLVGADIAQSHSPEKPKRGLPFRLKKAIFPPKTSKSKAFVAFSIGTSKNQNENPVKKIFPRNISPKKSSSTEKNPKWDLFGKNKFQKNKLAVKKITLKFISTETRISQYELKTSK